MAWQLVGSAEIGTDSRTVVVGDVVAPEVGGLILKVGSRTPLPSHYGEVTVSYRSAWGRELGALRVWPTAEPTVYHLGPGLRVRDRFGSLVVDPGSWGRRWALAGFRPVLDVLADVPSELLADSFTPPGIVSTDGDELILSPAGTAGRLRFPT
ncbi:MAG: hypothetical protein ACK57J_22670 [Rubrivivax sp.]|jgi:hypothetical protein